MFHLFDLPPEVHRMILQKLTTPELFDLITGRTKPDQVTNTSTEISQENPKGSLKILYQKARLELFKRRGPEASRLQSNLLASWLTHWSTEKKLSFIQNHSDKKEWLRLLDAALNDPQSSDEHKLRCCLLINKLFPDSQDIIPHITQTLLSDISNEKPVADELKAFTSEFLPVNISEIIDNLWAQLDDFGTSESKAAAQAMGAIAHRATQKQCGTMIGKLLTLTFQNGIAEVLKEIAPHATRAHCDSAISDLLPIMGKSDVYAFVESADAANAIIAIGPHASETECDEALANVLRKLKNDYGSLVAKQSGSSLGALVAHASKAQRDKMIFSRLSLTRTSSTV